MTWTNYTDSGLSVASAVPNATLISNANTVDLTLTMFNYQAGPEAMKTSHRLKISNANTQIGEGYWTGKSGNGMNAMRLNWNSTGSFDAGTYALYGVN